MRESLPYVDQGTQRWRDHSYDEMDRRTRSCRPADENDTACSAETSWSYRADTVTLRDAEGHVSNYKERPDRQLHSVTEVDPGGPDSVTRYRHTPFGQLSSITDADDSGPATLMSYDALGHLRSRIDVDMGTAIFEHNVFGELVRQADAKGKVATFHYDQLGRITSRDEPEGTTTWRYVLSGNGRGLLEIVTGPTDRSATGFGKQHSYNALGQLAYSLTRIDRPWRRTDYAYDDQGRTVLMIYPETLEYRPQFEYSYVNGYLDTVSQAGTPLYQIVSTDLYGRETSTLSGSGFINSLYEYDLGNGRLKRIETDSQYESGPARMQDYT
jgi:YD repeat-containing protein